jgi:hypothetical protein
MRTFGGKLNLKFRPNFNGTSPHFRDTLSKPCPVGSQLILNELRR